MFHLARYHDISADTRGPIACAAFFGLGVEDVFPIACDIDSVAIGNPASIRRKIAVNPKRRLDDDELMQRFALFWGLSWFAIVKGWHVTEFFMLTLFTVSAVKWWRNKITGWSIVGSMLLCIAFAASDEWHQSFIPDRFGTVQDVLIEILLWNLQA